MQMGRMGVEDPFESLLPLAAIEARSTGWN